MFWSKMVQIEGRVSSLFEHYAEMPPIFCKDSANRGENKKIYSFLFVEIRKIVANE
jgi:hypothetical protein